MKSHVLACRDLEWKMSADNNDLPHLDEITSNIDVQKLIKSFLDYGLEVRFTEDSAHVELRWCDIQLLNALLQKIDKEVADFLWSVLKEMERRYSFRVNWVIDLAIYVKAAELFGGTPSKK